MGTRTVIRIEGVNYAEIYKHWDGYPEHMLPWLKAFNKDFAKNRGDDASYKFAQCLRFAALNADAYSIDNSTYTGWGVNAFNSSGDWIEYTYILKTDGTVNVLPQDAEEQAA